MSAEVFADTSVIEPIAPEAEAERPDWAERIITGVATATAVLVVAAIGVVLGIG